MFRIYARLNVQRKRERERKDLKILFPPNEKLPKERQKIYLGSQSKSKIFVLLPLLKRKIFRQKETNEREKEDMRREL